MIFITSLKWEVDVIDLLSFTLSNFWWRTSLRKQRPFSALLYTPRKQFSKRVKLLGRNLKPKKASSLEGLWRTGQFRIIKIHFWGKQKWINGLFISESQYHFLSFIPRSLGAKQPYSHGSLPFVLRSKRDGELVAENPRNEVGSQLVNSKQAYWKYPLLLDCVTVHIDLVTLSCRACLQWVLFSFKSFQSDSYGSPVKFRK